MGSQAKKGTSTLRKPVCREPPVGARRMRKVGEYIPEPSREAAVADCRYAGYSVKRELMPSSEHNRKWYRDFSRLPPIREEGDFRILSLIHISEPTRH